MQRYFKFRLQRIFVSLLDVCSLYVAFIGAFLIRFDNTIPDDQKILFWKALPWLVVVKFPVFFIHGLYRNLWGYVGLKDIVLISRSILTAQVAWVIFISLFFAERLLGWPRSIFLLDTVLLLLLLTGTRVLYRLFKEKHLLKLQKPSNSVLIIGAGQTGNLLAREFSRPEQNVQVVGFLDDKPRLIGMRLQNVPILGAIDSLEKRLQALKPNEVIIAIPSLDGNRIRSILQTCQKHKIHCRICPPIRDVLIGRVRLNQLRDVAVEDLLRREVVRVNEPLLNEFLSGKCVMVTGAGGSIGSELCRQIMQFGPSRVVLYERSEYNLYRIEQELTASNNELGKGIQLEFVIGDILDLRRVEDTLKRFRPQIVLHAAAFKHVPLMEENVCEAVRNNVFGTYQVAEASARAGVERFVLVSTDKAVRPTSVMGASKRMAELVTQAIGALYPIKTFAVRFGNVLDSEGSVLPLFRKQIANGGPITLTHPEVTRYFMTIPEAAVLVLQSSGMGTGGEVFVLEMGAPVRIQQLAEELITLSGLRPHVDIKIVTTGLRKGEKLYEELLFDMKTATPTSHPKIMVANLELNGRLPADWQKQLKTFLLSEEIPIEEELRHWIKNWVPEFTLPEIANAASPHGANPSLSGAVATS
jgi:FlaA1/EpsC-like NDP-sugar epimerase